MPGEGEGEGQCADTSAVHVHDEDDFGGSAPVGAGTCGEAAGGKGGGGLEYGFGQRHVRLGQSHAETGHQEKR